MNKKPLSGKDLRLINFPEGRAIGIALRVMNKCYPEKTIEEKLLILRKLLNDPAGYLSDLDLQTIAEALIVKKPDIVTLSAESPEFAIYGADAIEEGALGQMRTAMKLPITVSGALMPDAHQGYGLPIGGVLATKNAVIPYGVGVDIGCRMCITLYDLPLSALDNRAEDFKKILVNNTKFGRSTFKKPKDDLIFERREFNEIKVVRELKSRAYEQIGSSGGGNHFVEFGIVEVATHIEERGIAPGRLPGTSFAFRITGLRC